MHRYLTYNNGFGFSWLSRRAFCAMCFCAMSAGVSPAIAAVDSTLRSTGQGGFVPRSQQVASGQVVGDFVTPKGQKTKGEIRSGHLYLIDANGRATPASDGTYRDGAGSSIIVQGGIVVQGGIIVQGGRVPSSNTGIKAIGPKQDDPAAPGKGRQSVGIQDDTIRPGGIKAIGPKQDDAAAPGKATGIRQVQ